jgi:hypothetical protein
LVFEIPNVHAFAKSFSKGHQIPMLDYIYLTRFNFDKIQWELKSNPFIQHIIFKETLKICDNIKIFAFNLQKFLSIFRGMVIKKSLPMIACSHQNSHLIITPSFHFLCFQVWTTQEQHLKLICNSKTNSWLSRDSTKLLYDTQNNSKISILCFPFFFFTKIEIIGNLLKSLSKFLNNQSRCCI